MRSAMLDMIGTAGSVAAKWPPRNVRFRPIADMRVSSGAGLPTMRRLRNSRTGEADMRGFLISATFAMVAVAPVDAQVPEIETRIAAQRQALNRLSFLDGVWRGSAWTMTAKGRHQLVQTERIGSFLNGSVKVIEGRGYEPNGAVSFNALGVISYNPDTRAYAIQSWAMGRSGSFPLKVTENGYVWETPAGPGAIIRYTATIDGKRFKEVGERIASGGAPMKILEMNLERVGKTTWPAADAVPMR